MPLRRTATVLALLLTALVVNAPGAHAGAPERAAHRPAYRTATSGQRCTIVGTPHADVLVGTSRADVICGLGGNDRIIGEGGNDVIDGGAGNDRVLGGGGNDVLDGGAGNDVAQGGAGSDTIDGSAGSDVLQGGSGGDTLTGDGGADQLTGQSGNDDLTGGSGEDTLSGGPGTNWCTVDSVDAATRCVYDLAAPKVVGARLDTDSVDVSAGSARLTMRFHATDDTGVTQLQFHVGGVSTGHATLRSGTVRDGWWDATTWVPRWTPGGPLDITVDSTDRVGRWGLGTSPVATLTVHDSAADLTAPVVTALPSPTKGQTYDVRSQSADVTIQARVQDDRSGAGSVYLCLDKPFDGGWTQEGACAGARRISGSSTNGLWSGSVTIPKGSPSGTWNVSVMLADQTGREADYYGPDMAAAYVAEGFQAVDYPILPGGAGRFTVLGTATDTHPPVLTAATLSATKVTTLTHSAAVAVTAHVTDVEGVSAVSAYLAGEQSADWSQVTTPPLDLTRTSGTARDGSWTGRITLPQGTPPGTYYLVLTTQDANHWTDWMATDTSLGAVDIQPISGDDRVTVVAE